MGRNDLAINKLTIRICFPDTIVKNPAHSGKIGIRISIGVIKGMPLPIPNAPDDRKIDAIGATLDEILNRVYFPAYGQGPINRKDYKPIA